MLEVDIIFGNGKVDSKSSKLRINCRGGGGNNVATTFIATTHMFAGHMLQTFHSRGSLLQIKLFIII